jgi:hypothetical protein
MHRCPLITLVCLTLVALPLHGADYFVSPSGADAQAGSKDAPWKTLQHALSRLKAGDTANALAGVYHEKLVIPASGTAGAMLALKGEPGAIISGKGVKGESLILIENQSYVRVIGFELRDNLDVRDGSAIRVQGSGSHIELRQCRIHEIRGKDAMGITVYGTSKAAPISQIIIDGNEIYDCEPAKSEALVLNGNVNEFQVTNNVVRDVNNIGIDFIGGEAWANEDAANVARNGLCKGNKVMRCKSNYEDGYAAGIYVDGGKNIIIENNIVMGCDLGIEIGAENRHTVTSGIIVRNNTIYRNDKAGLVFGGFEKKAGRVMKCQFTGNRVYQNNRHKEDHNGELWVQWASENEVTGNSFITTGDSPLIQVDAGGAVGNKIDKNRFYTDVGAGQAFFLWRGSDVTGLGDWKTSSGMDASSTFGPVEIELPAEK